MQNNNNESLKNEYKGYSLFNDVEDLALQERNRAVIMCNIVEHNTHKGQITPRGAGLAMGYFSKIPAEQRKGVEEKFEELVKGRGYARKAA